jgi:hypothetical protein
MSGAADEECCRLLAHRFQTVLVELCLAVPAVIHNARNRDDVAGLIQGIYCLVEQQQLGSVTAGGPGQLRALCPH